jgi:hypothetical protein
MGTLAKTVGLRACALLGGTRQAEGVPILAYHSVDNSGSYLSTSPEIFAAEVACLAKLGCTGVSVARLISLAQRPEPIPAGTVGLTFDDGLQNFMDSAWPILKLAGFSATIFVPVDFVGGAATWFAAHGLSPLPVLSWDALRRLRDESVDIGSHGCTHRKLTSLSASDIREELARSKAALGRELGIEIDHFCYPYGDVNDAVKTAVQSCGYRTACTTIPGRHRAGDDPYAIRRASLDMVDIADAKTAERVIEACVKGSYTMYSKIKIALHQLLGSSRAEPRQP